VGGGTILLEPLEDLDDPSLSTKCCPELAKHLDISLGVDCHRPLVVVLEPEWSNDARFGVNEKCMPHFRYEKAAFFKFFGLHLDLEVTFEKNFGLWLGLD